MWGAAGARWLSTKKYKTFHPYRDGLWGERTDRPSLDTPWSGNGLEALFSL
jgi:hypothetical protein